MDANLEPSLDLRELVRRYGVERVLCCFSGGKDSLVATHVAHGQLRGLVPIEVVHVDTTVSLPGVQDYVRSVCERYGWRLVILRPKESFWELASRWGMPTPKRRWCCYRLKLEPMLEYAASLGLSRVAFVTGLRRSESRRRESMRGVYVREFRGVTMYSFDPIIGWSGEQVEEYIRRHGLPISPVYGEVSFSGECICCAFTTLGQLTAIARRYPEFIERFRALEEAWRRGKFAGKKYEVFYAGGLRLSVDGLLRMAGSASPRPDRPTDNA